MFLLHGSTLRRNSRLPAGRVTTGLVEADRLLTGAAPKLEKGDNKGA